MKFEMEFEENPLLTPEENKDGRESLDGFNEMFNTTCNILSTFKGPSGQRTVVTVVSLVRENPELQQFLFEFYYNTRAADRIKAIYNEE